MPTREQQPDRQIGEREAAVQHVGDLLARASSRSRRAPRAATIRHLGAPHADPDQLADEARMRFVEARPARRARAGCSRRRRCRPSASRAARAGDRSPRTSPTARARAERIVAALAHAEDDVAGVGLELAEELDDELRRLLQVRRHHGEVRSRGLDQSGADRGERAEVARHLEHLRVEARRAAAPRRARERAVRAAVDDEHDLERAAELARRGARARRGGPGSSPRCDRRGLRASSGSPCVARRRDGGDLGVGELRVARQRSGLRRTRARCAGGPRRRVAGHPAGDDRAPDSGCRSRRRPPSRCARSASRSLRADDVEMRRRRSLPGNVGGNAIAGFAIVAA